MDLLDRKSNLFEKSSNVVLDLVHSSETTVKTLQHDLDALKAKAKEYTKSVEQQTNENEKDHQGTGLASQKLRDVLIRLSEEEQTIQNIQKELESTEVVLKQKQHICEALKNKCNTRSKALVVKHEEIEKNEERVQCC